MKKRFLIDDDLYFVRWLRTNVQRRSVDSLLYGGASHETIARSLSEEEEQTKIGRDKLGDHDTINKIQKFAIRPLPDLDNSGEVHRLGECGRYEVPQQKGIIPQLLIRRKLSIVDLTLSCYNLIHLFLTGDADVFFDE